MSTEATLRESIVRYGHSMFERGLTFGSSGNISARLEDGWLMTPTNVALDRLDPARLSRLDGNGKLLSGDAPTKESFLHIAMYRERPSSGAVVHLHSTHSVAVSCLADVESRGRACRRSRPTTSCASAACRWCPSIRPAIRRWPRRWRSWRASITPCLLANHGPVVAGTSLDAAVNAIEELEETARLFLLLRREKTRWLTPAQVADVRRRYPPD